MEPKIVIIEDDQDYAKTLVDFLKEMLSLSEKNLSFTGGLYQETEAWLENFSPAGEEKIIFVVDGTLAQSRFDFGVDEGNGFGLFFRWLSNLITQMEERGKPKEEIENLLRNFCVILNTGDPKMLKEDFPPYKQLRELCEGRVGKLVTNHLKDISGVTEAITDFISREGNRPGIERKGG